MAPDEENKSEQHSPLTTVDLRYNRLKGSIILGNYEVSFADMSEDVELVTNSVFLSSTSQL